VGIGGDSTVALDQGRIVIGPERKGPAAAFGGPGPTPTDAMVVLGLVKTGDREAAARSLRPLAEQMKYPLTEAAGAIFAQTCDRIVQAVTETLEEINNHPVYTIHEFLEGKIVAPQALYVVGGPAHVLAEPLGARLGYAAHVPEHAEVANAIGAALSRTTAEITILADTEQGILTVGEEGLQMAISPRFTREEAIAMARAKLREKALQLGADPDALVIEITEDQVFPMVRDFYATGKNIRIKAQIKPGLMYHLEGGK
jgi:N-methylhydantoinase A